MYIGPTPEFRAACRIVLGGDDPQTVISALRESGPRWDQVRKTHAEIVNGERQFALLTETSKEAGELHKVAKQ